MTTTKNTPTTTNNLDNVTTVLGPLLGICVTIGNAIGDSLSDIIDAVFDDDD